MTGVRRLLGLGSVVVDLVLHVDRLPEPGGDVLARSSATAVGGGLNALAAAASAGLPAAYAGGHGTGPFGDLVRAALASHGVPALLPPTADRGHRLLRGARGRHRRAHLRDDGGRRGPADRRRARRRCARRRTTRCTSRATTWSTRTPRRSPAGSARLPAGTTVVLDPGPLVGDIDPALLDAVLARTTWLSLNGREAQLVTGEPDPTAAVAALLGQGARPRRGGGPARRPGRAGRPAGHGTGRRARRTGRARSSTPTAPGTCTSGRSWRPWRPAPTRWPPRPSPTGQRRRRCRRAGLGGWGRDAAHGSCLAAPAGAHASSAAPAG